MEALAWTSTSRSSATMQTPLEGSSTPSIPAHLVGVVLVQRARCCDPVDPDRTVISRMVGSGRRCSSETVSVPIPDRGDLAS